MRALVVIYCLVIVEDFTRYTWTLFLGDKSETPDKFKIFAKRAQREFGLNIVKVQSDNGSEFKNYKVDEWCDEEGIKHEFSATYTPQQNGVVERKNKTLITLARAMLDDYSTSEDFWAEAINTACHATNRVYLHRLLGRHLMSSSLGGNPTSPTFGSSVTSASSTKRKGSVNSKNVVILVSLWVMHQTQRHTVYSIKPPE